MIFLRTDPFFLQIWSPFYWGSANWMWFGFDPLGRCVKRWVGLSGDPNTTTAATYFYYDGWNLIQEGPSAALVDRTYVHGARVDEIVASRVSGAWYHHLYDARGHCIMLTNTSGGIQEQYEYDAFGQPYIYDANGSLVARDLGSPAGNRFLFTGREWLKELRVYDYRARLYQPELGRFLQPDPKQFDAGDYNLYRYCHNDPVNKNDPTGLSSPEVITDDKRERVIIESEYKFLRQLPAFKGEFDKIDKNPHHNFIKNAQSRDNRTLGTSPNGLKVNRTERHFGGRELWRDLKALFGIRTDYGVGATSFYDPSSRQTASGGDREPIFGLANELGEMINANNGTWGTPNQKDNDNRSIWFENQAREAFGANARPYY
jgi:RHS repeat-associated protein